MAERSNIYSSKCESESVKCKTVSIRERWETYMYTLIATKPVKGKQIIALPNSDKDMKEEKYCVLN